MLQSLIIKDFILINELNLNFTNNFCAITGRSGTGKSILLNAILFGFGKKVAHEVIRPGAELCSVSLIFAMNPTIKLHPGSLAIDRLTIDRLIKSGDQLVIKRTQSKLGRNRFSINDQPVSAKSVRELFPVCLDIQGQHSYTALFNPDLYLEIVDKYGNLLSLRQEVEALYKEYCQLEQRLKLFKQEEEKIKQELDYFTHICSELEQANILAGEEQELIEIKKRLQTRDKETALIKSVLQDIETSNINSIIAKSQRNIIKLESYNAHDNNQRDKINNCLEEAYNKIEDARLILQELLGNFDLNYNLEGSLEGSLENKLEQIEERLSKIRELARKNNCTSAELPDFLQKSQGYLQLLQHKSGSADQAGQHLNIIKEQYLDKAGKLSRMRREAAVELEVKVRHELDLLYLNRAIFKIAITTKREKFLPTGIDRIDFIAAINPGSVPGPIDKIASGGELSRFMLGLRVILFGRLNDTVKNTIIFDEIDVGISGNIADAVGERLRILSKTAQVIVITHQPQVAGKAGQHILVEKEQHASSTDVAVTVLTDEGRISELARMISGRNITPGSLQAAKELMN